MLLNVEKAALIVIDVQGNLAQAMDQKETLFANLKRMIEGAKVLGLPIIWTEQVPDKLGETIPEIKELVVDASAPISKSSFSCCGEPTFMEAVRETQRSQMLVTGIEAHVCVYQTVLDLLEADYEVQIVTDAVSSRHASNKQLGVARMKEAGATLTSTEMSLFELLRVAEGEKFRSIIKIVK